MKKSTLTITLIVVLIVFPLAAALLAPPDIVSEVALVVLMTVIFGISAFVVSRFKSFGQTPESIKRLIIVLICVLSITIVYSVTTSPRNIHWPGRSPSEYSSEGGMFSLGNLWVGYSSVGGIDNVVCSVDSPETCTSGGPRDRWMIAFPKGNSVEFAIINQQTVWIDKEHRVTFLGPVLGKEDVSLMRKHGHDEALKISSPDQLLAVVKQFKGGQAGSTPAKAQVNEPPAGY